MIVSTPPILLTYDLPLPSLLISPEVASSAPSAPFSWRDSPKSESLAMRRGGGPRRTLAGLRSRWSTALSCRYAIPIAMSAAMRHNSQLFHPNCSFDSRSDLRLVGMSSITIPVEGSVCFGELLHGCCSFVPANVRSVAPSAYRAGSCHPWRIQGSSPHAGGAASAATCTR